MSRLYFKMVFSLLMMAAIMLASCKENGNIVPVSSKMNVTVYSDALSLSKTSLGVSNSVVWSTSDHICLFYKKTGLYAMEDFSCTSVEEDGLKAIFTGSSAAVGASSYVALYPYNSDATCSSDGLLETTLPGIQTATSENYDPMSAIAVARGTDKDMLLFRNKTSLLGIQPKETGVTSVTLVGTAPMSGKFNVDADGTIIADKTSNSVRLSGTMTSGTEYYASVLPGSNTNLKIVLGRNDGKYASFTGESISLGCNELRHLFAANVSSWKTPSSIYINEIQCNASGSMIEIYNPGVSAVNLYGWVLIKNDKELYAFSQGTSVPAGGFLTVLCGKTSEMEGATFDLSGTEGFDLKLCCGVVVDHIDNLTTIRTIADGHSLGRLRDGEETWTAFSTATIGSSNTGGTQEPSTSGIRLNEINGDYSGGDYIELYNAGNTTECLDHFKIRRYRFKDGIDDEQTLWKGTSGVSLAPGEYLVLYYKGDIDNNNEYPLQLQRSFSAKKNTYFWLQDNEERVVGVFQRGTKNSGWNNINMQKVKASSSQIPYSYSFVGNSWVYANPSPGIANNVKVFDIDQTMCPVVINEINFSGNWVELYNMGNTPIDINGLQIRWSRIQNNIPDNQTVHEWKTSTIIAPGGYLTVSMTKVNFSSYAGKNIHIRLRSGNKADPTGENIIWDDFKRGVVGSGWTTQSLVTITTSVIRVPDGSGKWYRGNSSKETTNGTSKSGGLCPDVIQ